MGDSAGGYQSDCQCADINLNALNLCRLIGGGTFKVNLHVPGCRHTTAHKSLAGTWGIPEFMPPNRRRDFQSKKTARMLTEKGRKAE